jgi:hypothetical protein
MRGLHLSWRRGAIAVVLAGALTIVAWKTGGWFDVHGGYYGRNLTAVRIMLFVALAVLAYVLPGVMRRTSRVAWIVFAAWTAYLAGWLLALWPGIVMTDTHSAVANARLGVIWEWFSWIHAAYVMALMDIVPHVWAMSVVQVLATAATMAYASHVLMAWRPSVPAVIALNVIAALSVAFVVNAVLLSRDTIYTLMQIALALAVAQVVTRQRPLTPVRLAWIAAVTGLLSVYRGDGLALLVVVPALLLVLRPRPTALAGGAAAFTVAAVLFHTLLPLAFNVEDDNHRYELSLRINPLGAVLRTDFWSTDKARDLQQLGRVIDVEAVRDMHDPSEIPAFWANKFNQAATDADYAAFRSVADRLLLENAVTVLANRVETFGAATGLARRQFTTPAVERERRFEFVSMPDGIRAEPPFPGLYDAAAKVIRRTQGFSGAVSTRSALFWNFLPWLALLMVALAMWRRQPFIAAFAAVVVCRVPLVFLFSPASQYKYYLAVHLGGIVALGLFLAVVRREDAAASVRRSRAGRSSDLVAR